jgi:hypothetical protein
MAIAAIEREHCLDVSGLNCNRANPSGAHAWRHSGSTGTRSMTTAVVKACTFELRVVVAIPACVTCCCCLGCVGVC